MQGHSAWSCHRGTASPLQQHRPRVPSLHPNYARRGPRHARMHIPGHCRATEADGAKEAWFGINFYEVLKVSEDAPTEDIKRAYRRLQKKCHPDIAGEDEGTKMSRLLNKIYDTLMHDGARAAYDEAAGVTFREFRSGGEDDNLQGFTGRPKSKWSGGSKNGGLFVNESVCIGCRACAQYAPNTFLIDEATGKARVFDQWADSEGDVETAREVCPVDCIHCVPLDMLPVLEHIMPFCVKNEVPGRDPSRLHQGLQNPFIRMEVFEKQFAAERRRREAAAAKAMKGGGSLEDLQEMCEAARAIERFSRL